MDIERVKRDPVEHAPAGDHRAGEAQCPEPFERVPYLSHIGYMTADEVAEGLEAGDGRACGRQPLIDPDLRLAGLEMGSSRLRAVSRGKAALSSDLDAGQAPEGSLVMESIFVCGSCVQ
jgi:hypothetical protein